jgi:carboxymethylenebutenolidase
MKVMTGQLPEHRASDFDPEVLLVFDQYVHGDIDRRGFLERVGQLVGAGAALGVLSALTPRFASAQQVPPTDARLDAKTVEFDSPQGYGKARGYLVRPRAARGKLPTVLVVHENRGLNPHIEDVARRLALENFLVLAPDALFPLGGYPGDEDKARELFPKLEQPKTQEDFVAASAYALGQRDSNGKLGVVGFCYGGSMSNLLAQRLPNLKAAAPFYGGAPPLDRVPAIKAEMMLHFAGTDERVNAGWPAYEEALKKAGVKYQAFVYPNTQHGFNNDTTPRYDADAARLAWSRTLALFKRALS